MESDVYETTMQFAQVGLKATIRRTRQRGTTVKNTKVLLHLLPVGPTCARMHIL